MVLKQYLKPNKMEAPQIAVLTVPLNEWNEQKALLREMADQVRALTNKEHKELLTPKEVCAMLKISRSTYERYLNDGIIEATKVNKAKYSKNYVKRSDIENLIRNGRV